ncbi:MAG: histidine phosphatase family protein [Sandaracinaceae bacterium]|nr:histidine phosphatase family protein [Sandaracinaceae bacterium]
MKILLMRHGDAVRNDGPDEARHLSRTGRHDSLSVARALAAKLHGERVDFVISSHLVRAVQTAEIVVGELTRAGTEVDPMVHADPIFEPDASPRHAAQRLESLAARHAPHAILCVCHEPIVRGIAAHLGGASGSFTTSGLACIERGRTVWTLDPRSLA